MIRGEYKKSIDLLIEAWNKLSNDKVQYDESFLIVWGILEISIQINEIDIMNQWVDKIFIADPERGDTGERCGLEELPMRVMKWIKQRNILKSLIRNLEVDVLEIMMRSIKNCYQNSEIILF